MVFVSAIDVAVAVAVAVVGVDFGVDAVPLIDLDEIDNWIGLAI